MPSYTHAIRLAENVEAGMFTASLSQRFWAFVLDTLVMLGIVVVAALGFSLFAFFSEAVVYFGMIAGTFVYFAYFFVCEALLVGQTVGKLATGIRVVSLDGQPMTATAGLVRSFARFPMVVSGMQLPIAAMGESELGTIGVILMSCACIDALYAVGDPRSRRLGDVAAGTVVVSQRLPQAAPDAPRLPRYTELQPQLFPVRAEELNRLSPTDLAMLEEFGARIRSFRSPRREQAAAAVAGALAARMRYHLAIPPLDAERFLYEVHCAMRDRFRQLYPDLYPG